MRKCLIGAVCCAVAACGNVAKLTDANRADAPDLDAFACTTSNLLACGDACFDPMITQAHCGGCDIACVDGADCVAGHCTDDTASCFAIKQFNPAATDGMYTHKNDGTQFFCDMTHSLQYDELAFAQFNVAHAGYTQIGATDLADPIVQQAFIGLYNVQGGLDNIAPNWPSSGCCAIRGTSAVNMDFKINATFVSPGLAGSNSAACLPQYPDPKYRFTIGNTVFPPTTLPTDYFTTNPVTEFNQCTDSNNPAFFVKRHAQ